MKPGARLILALAGAVVLLPGVVTVMAQMPEFGRRPLPYGGAINHAAPTERHVTNMVTAVNFDYRDIDTLGEEYMLLAAVTGVLVLLRGRRGENVSDAPAQAQGRAIPPRSPAVIGLLPPLPVAQPLAMAALLLRVGKFLPCGDLVIGIGFVIGQADAAVAALIALLFAATFVFAWAYFEDIRAFFHVLMLLFLAAMEGFCFTHDLFNPFVWFEVMSVTAFALTAYRREASSLEGALNSTVMNSIASFLMLGGIGLLYLRAGALDFAALSQSVAAAPHDPVAAGAFCILATAPPVVPRTAAPHPFLPWLTIGLSILIAGHDLARARLPKRWLAVSDRLVAPRPAGRRRTPYDGAAQRR